VGKDSLVTLDDLGSRICILGPSNSGKSTLATAISRARGIPSIHLDQLYHLPNSDWQPRPDEEFLALHNEAILESRWVMEGNYSRCLPQRLERATGVVLLDASTVTSLLRYLRRSWFERERNGTLEGGSDSVNWEMIRHIAIVTPGNRKRYEKIFDQIILPKITLSTTRELECFYRNEGLDR
jgi:adenylate kinase family enzyme